MRREIAIVLGCILATMAAAQPRTQSSNQPSKGNIEFTVKDQNTRKPVQGAVIEVRPAVSTAFKKYYTSAPTGIVSFSLPYGEYILTASFIGYKDTRTRFVVDAAKKSLGNIYLKESPTEIGAVVKTAKQLHTSQNADTLTYNAAAFKVSADAEVEALLQKMPGITIEDGKIDVQGETVKKVFVDGEEFFADDPNTAIKTLPAEAIDKVEVFDKLSDEAEFSGMDDGESYKAINLVTKKHMRNGAFGKMYAGMGYQERTDGATFNPKYLAGGNFNLFKKKRRISIIGLFNNTNQQNFSFEDLLGVSESSGKGSNQADNFMVRQQNGVSLVNAIGLNYNDTWGRKSNLKIQGSYFFNTTRTKNHSFYNTWFEAPSPWGTRYATTRSDNTNSNHRFNLKLQWKINRTTELVSRTSFSYQGHNPDSYTYGFTNGDSELVSDEEREEMASQRLSFQHSTTSRNQHGMNLAQFLQYRIRLGKPGRTMTVDGRFNYRDNINSRHSSTNEASGIPYAAPRYGKYYDMYFSDGADWMQMEYDTLFYKPLYQSIRTPVRNYNMRAGANYNEPLGKNTRFTFQYRFTYKRSTREQSAYYTDEFFSDQSKRENPDLTKSYETEFLTHRLGPGIRYSKKKSTLTANLFWSHHTMLADIMGSHSDRIRRAFNHVQYFAMARIPINSENNIRLSLRSSVDDPSIHQMQSIVDISSPQYMSLGNSSLKPAYTHSLNFHYTRTNVEKGRTFMFMIAGSYTSDYICESTLYNPSGWQLPDRIGDLNIPLRRDGSRYSPTEISAYENLDGDFSLRSRVTFGIPITALKCNLNLGAGIRYSSTPTAIYTPGPSPEHMLESIENHDFSSNRAKHISYHANVALGSNISDKVDFLLSWSGAFNQAWNTASQIQKKNDYFRHTAKADMKYVIWRGFTLTLSAAYTQWVGFTSSYNEHVLLCNAFLGKKFLKSQRAEVQIGVYDMFNQQKAFSRSTGSGFTRNSYNSVMGRYYMLSFTYNLRAFTERTGPRNASHSAKRQQRSDW